MNRELGVAVVTLTLALAFAVGSSANAATTLETFPSVSSTAFPSTVQTTDGLFLTFSQDPMMETPGSDPQALQTTVSYDSIGFEKTSLGQFGLVSVTAQSEGAPEAAELVGYQAGTGTFTIPVYLNSTPTVLPVNLSGLYDINLFPTGGPSTVALDSFTAISSAVPEPRIWTMIFLGFGGLGAAMRRTRRFRAASTI